MLFEPLYSTRAGLICCWPPDSKKQHKYSVFSTILDQHAPKLMVSLCFWLPASKKQQKPKLIVGASLRRDESVKAREACQGMVTCDRSEGSRQKNWQTVPSDRSQGPHHKRKQSFLSVNKSQIPNPKSQISKLKTQNSNCKTKCLLNPSRETKKP